MRPLDKSETFVLLVDTALAMHFRLLLGGCMMDANALLRDHICLDTSQVCVINM